MDCGVYMVSCLETGKRYVGVSVNMASRMKSHQYDLVSGRHHNKYLQGAWNKHGSGSFVFDILESAIDIYSALEREKYWIVALDLTNPARGFNLVNEASYSLGKVWPKELRETASQRAKKRNAALSKDQRAAMTKKWSEIGKRGKGRKFPPEFGIMTGMKQAKVTPAQRTDICNQYFEGASQGMLARHYGITQACVSLIVMKKQRQHLYEPGIYERNF